MKHYAVKLVNGKLLSPKERAERNYSMIYNIALGAINRAMPQLLVSFVGAPAITFGGMALLFLAGPIMLSKWLELLHRFINDPFGGG